MAVLDGVGEVETRVVAGGLHRVVGLVILGVICARAGSKGLPGKNVRLLRGKPLLNWSIDHAISTPEIDKVVVTADFDLDSRYHEYNIGRPKELAGDTVSKWDVWKWVADYWESEGNDFDAICDLDPTQPLRTVQDVSGSISCWRPGTVLAAVAAGTTSPYYDILEKTPSGTYRISKGGGAYMCRQELPPSYVQSGIYVVSREALRTRRHLFDGEVHGYEMPRERSFDINDETDWRITELFMGGTHTT